MKRRDFLITSGAAASVFVASGSDAQQSWSQRYAQPTVVRVSVGSMGVGQQISVKVGSQITAIRRRSQAEIEHARSVDVSTLADPLARNANLPENSPATDTNRTIDADGEWFVYNPACTHLGLITLRSAPPREGESHWIFCPSHGGKFDAAGRVVGGPVPRNLAIPVAKFITDDILEIHSNSIFEKARRVQDADPWTW